MKLIIGLGNPGEKYENTRHNLGFMALDKFLKEYSLAGRDNWKKETKFKSEVAEIEWQKKSSKSIRRPAEQDLEKQKKWTPEDNLEKVLLVKPLTHMNLSGSAVSAVVAFYKVPTENIWVVHDDIDLNFGAMKIRLGGASAGHNGVGSIISSLGTDKFWRFRLGIGHPINKSKINQLFGGHKSKMIPVDEYVLRNFGRGEGGKLKDIIKKAVKALESGLESSLDATMNRFNAK
jgi:peptidyl-tRNA hydrolase, PTH1 family